MYYLKSFHVFVVKILNNTMFNKTIVNAIDENFALSKLILENIKSK